MFKKVNKEKNGLRGLVQTGKAEGLVTKVRGLSPAPCELSLVYKWCKVEGGPDAMPLVFFTFTKEVIFLIFDELVFLKKCLPKFLTNNRTQENRKTISPC